MKYLLIVALFISSCCICKKSQMSNPRYFEQPIYGHTLELRNLYYEDTASTIEYCKKQMREARKCDTDTTAYFLYSFDKDVWAASTLPTNYHMNFVNGKRYNLWTNNVSGLNDSVFKDWYLVNSGCIDTMKITVR